MKILYASLLLLLFSNCNSDSGNINADKLANFAVDIIVYENNSGIVVINANADNATEFQFDMGESGIAPIIQSNGDYEHQYAVSGSYLVKVRVYNAEGRYRLKEKRIAVVSGGIVDVDDGYSTPLSYDGMKLVWNDEFNDDKLNTDNWSYDNGTGCPNLCGWGNNELQYYRPENSWMSNGALVIEARKEEHQGSKYTSTKIVTRDKQAFQYGRIDIRAKLPKGQGLWPALWMLGQNHAVVGWPKCGEIDIMEMVGGNNRERTTHGNAFWDNNGVTDFAGGYTLPSGRFYDEFHVFTLIWDKEQLRYYVDDNLFHSNDITTPDKTEFHKPFYLIFNVAIGGNWPGSPNDSTEFPTQMQVDYIRVFQEK